MDRDVTTDAVCYPECLAGRIYDDPVCVLPKLGEIMRRHELGFPGNVEYIQPGAFRIPALNFSFVPEGEAANPEPFFSKLFFSPPFHTFHVCRSTTASPPLKSVASI